MKKNEELTVKVIEKRKTKETCTCDICKSLIYEKTCADSEELPKNILFVKYYHAVTGHHDWGNDSCDSVEGYDICSIDCLRKLFDNFTKEKSNTAYLEIDTETSTCFKAGDLVKQSNKYWMLEKL